MYGAVIALKVSIVILIGTLASLAVDPDELLRIVRRLSFRSALTASLSVRMIPLLAADAQRLAEAQRTRPRAPRGARARIAILAAVLEGSLDRAMDVAATLELRGFATARRAPRRPLRPWSRHDLAFALSAVAVLGLGAAGAAAVPFAAYPRVHAALGATAAVLCLALVVAGALPFCDRRGIEQ